MMDKKITLKKTIKGSTYFNNNHVVRVNASGAVSYKGQVKSIRHGDLILLPKNTVITYFIYQEAMDFSIDVFKIKGSRKKVDIKEFYSILTAMNDIEKADIISKDYILSLLREKFIEQKTFVSCQSSKLEQINKLVSKDPTRNWSLDDICKNLYLSKSTLSRKLKEDNMSPSHIITLARLKLSANLVKNTKLSISEISYSVGFNSATYFCKKFKEYFGLTPKEFRHTFRL